MEIFKPHSEDQHLALFSKKPIVIAATGIQWGKTMIGVVWLKMMMHMFTDKTDNFLVTSPTYKILEQSTIPPFNLLCGDMGVWDKKNSCFHVHGGGTVWFRTGKDPDSPVGITNVRAVLCDEAGLYSLYFWENIQARASFKEAPIRIVTSPYSLNWLYKDWIRPWRKGDEYVRQELDLIQARSCDNPYFPMKEFLRKKATMDLRRFNMMYGGRFDKAEGLVYDIWSESAHVIDKPHTDDLTYYAGVDWGYTDPFVIKVRGVSESTGNHYSVDEYFKPGLTESQLIDAARRMKDIYNIKRFYCDPSRPEYIESFNRSGLPSFPADNAIRLGIDAHYELMKDQKFYVIKGRNPHTIDEYEQYHYPQLKDLKPDQKQKDELPVDKSNHCCDADRYLSKALSKKRRKKNRVITHTEAQEEVSLLIDKDRDKLLTKRRKIIVPRYM